MTKIAIKSDNITSFGEIFHVMDTFFFLEEKIVFMLVTAMLKNFYLYLLGTLTDKMQVILCLCPR